ncbi:phosphatase PAP2 family protein [Curtobacterium sp. MCLR17_007]|uniref:phosphatase PAP2 family protein n=1 Tax=Curtobacterium sp. MCLR17_007 TaxID=2175648 RepID=UPI000DAA9721|nr:phosphatase PAP2 family protein [Curtobacterium sp. MCLR17_007]WIB60178.1 phosphatase PAP2 family protein [Curtobacterium sp. MCLR17_007]
MTDPGTSTPTSDSTPTATTRYDRRIGRRDVTEWRSRAGKRLAERHRSLAQRVGARRALVTTLAVGGGIAVAATAAAAYIYDGVTGRDGIESLDGPALARAKRLRSPAVDGAAAGIAHAFGPVAMPVLTIGAAVGFAVRDRRLSPATLLVAAGAGSLAMTLIGKDLIKRNRPRRRDAIPPFEKSPSFPSGHTLNATTILGVIAYLMALRQERDGPQVAVIGTAAGTALTVGLSRVLLGAHWFTDVAVGWVTGAGWLSMIITSHRLYLSTQDDDGARHRADRVTTGA